MYYLLETFTNLSPTAIWQWRYETLQSLSGWHHSHEPAGHTTLRGSCFARCEWQQVPTGRWYPDPLARLLLTPLLTACLNSSPLPHSHRHPDSLIISTDENQSNVSPCGEFHAHFIQILQRPMSGFSSQRLVLTGLWWGLAGSYTR